MSPHIARIEQRLHPLRDRLLNHPLYNEIDRLDALHVFMEHHVFAVWDFMSLLKALQQRLCCAAVPWLPPQDPQACRFINEIVLAEESDEDGNGGFGSHFDLYCRSMKQCGAKTSVIEKFLTDLDQGVSVTKALPVSEIPEAVRPFVKQTFSVIDSGNLTAIAAAFTYGREDLLPDVFQRIVDELDAAEGGRLADFRYYLKRHIDLDGDEHGPMATRLIQSLCGSDDSQWRIAEETAVDCLVARQQLWDGIYEAVRK